jgi:hypothetical protein
MLKTYLVVSVSGDTVNIARDPYKHVPFVGDKLGVAPEAVGGDMTAAAVTKVAKTTVKVDGVDVDVWALTFGSALSAEKGDVLVEAGEDNKMLVKAINAVAHADMDMLDAPATGEEDFDGARYSYTPALGGIMYINKMSPLPDCVKKLNIAKVNGWYQVQSV